jgi:hypothetical protein
MRTTTTGVSRLGLGLGLDRIFWLGFRWVLLLEVDSVSDRFWQTLVADDRKLIVHINFSASYALPVASRETTTTTTNTNSSTTAATTYQAEQTGSTGTSDIVPSAPEASTTTASAHTHTHTHEPSEPIKELADATSTSGTSSSADRTNENVTGSHEPADPLKALAAATAPVLGASPGATNLKAEKEMNTADHTPAGPIKALADSTSPLGTSATSATTESRAREGNVGTKNVPSSTATTEEHGFAETFTHAGTSTLAALGAAASGLVMGVNEIVHNATGVDIVHRQPVSLFALAFLKWSGFALTVCNC